MRFAQILNNKVHWIFESETQPRFAPNIKIVDITNMNPQPEEGWDWDPIGKKATPPPKPDPMPEIREKRNQLLRIALDRIDRYDKQVRAGVPTTDSLDAINQILQLLQPLRDFPETCNPDNPDWSMFSILIS